MFLSHCIPLLDRSGLNVQGAFNDAHSTPVEEVPEVQPAHVLRSSSYNTVEQCAVLHRLVGRDSHYTAERA